MYTRAPIVTLFLHVSSNCGPRNVGEGHQAGQMVEQSNKEKSAKRAKQLKASKQVLFHEQKITKVTKGS